MDKDRQIRFLYPPLIFLSSIALGVWLDYPNSLSTYFSSMLTNSNTTNVMATLLGLGSLVLVLGYLIGTVTILFLRLLFFSNRFNYEFKLSKQTYEQIGKLIFKDKDDTVEKKERMYAAIVFDHSHINDRIHGWIVRRWNAFMIASFSVVGLLGSLIFGPPLGFSVTCGWFLTVNFFILCFMLQSWLSHRETMRMISFLTRVENKPSKDGGSNENAANNVYKT
jgi:hypothetical protein